MHFGALHPQACRCEVKTRELSATNYMNASNRRGENLWKFSVQKTSMYLQAIYRQPIEFPR
jgi:6-phosphogluconolactonase (cycloisomerase 2 family)